MHFENQEGCLILEPKIDNPIEYLWKKVKTKATHNRYFAEFVKLIQSVEEALKVLATQADEILRLMGVYTKNLAAPTAV